MSAPITNRVAGFLASLSASFVAAPAIAKIRDLFSRRTLKVPATPTNVSASDGACRDGDVIPNYHPVTTRTSTLLLRM
jgi:hypothetical protein